MKQVQSIFIVLFLCVLTANAQVKDFKTIKQKDASLSKNGLDKSINSNSKTTKATKVDTKASDYKFISIDRDTTYIDTTLNIKKEYRYNYLRKDYFELLPFSNTGQVFNQLGYDFTQSRSSFSQFGARAKHIDYAEVEDIKYYNVATPLTELFFKTTMEQGQLADGFFTVNTTPQFNMSIGYKGLRSIGKYRHIKTNGGKFRSSLSYNTKNRRYLAKAHITMQAIENQENGGILDDLIDDFESKNKEYKDRSRFEVNFEDADNKLSAKRFYLNHYYNIFRQQDSTTNYALSVGHVSNFEDKKYQFNQSAENVFFGDAFVSSISDEVRLEKFYNKGYVSFEKNKIGTVTINAGYADYNYGYHSLVFLTSGNIPNRLKGGFASYGADYKNEFGKLKLSSSFTSNLSEDNKGSLFNADLKYSLKSTITAKAEVVVKESLPDFNYRLYQSDYKNYNWYNPDLKTVKTKVLAASIDAKKYGALKVSYTAINNHAYFGVDAVTNSVKPLQFENDIKYLKLSVNKELKYRKFALDNTVQYQKVTQSEEVLNVPDLIVRSSLYFTDAWFEKNLFIQIGLIGSYFSEYKMNAYDPLLSEFYVQTQKEYGAYPRLDFFVNAKVRNARIYLKAEHFNSAWTGNDFYSAPNYPYKDFTVRFGLVWDFFL